MTHDAGTTPTAPRWTPGEDATLMRLRAEGQSARQIGQVLGRTFKAVQARGDILRAQGEIGTALGIPPPTKSSAPTVEVATPEPESAPTPFYTERMDSNGRRHWTPEEDARLVSLRADGMQDDEIAAVLGRTTGSTQQRVMKLRMEGGEIASRKRRSPWTPERVAEAWAMRDEGLTRYQIARRLGADASSVERALRSPETTEDSPGEGVRVGRTVPDHTRTALALADARAALARAQARHREAMEAILGPVREAMHETGLIALPVDTDDDEEDPAFRLVDQLRRRGVEMRRVA